MPQTAPLYVALASLCQRRENLRNRPQFNALNRVMLTHVEMEIDRLVECYMPSGSGFDAGTQLIDSDTPETKLVFQTGFHHMDEHGGYDGWTHHQIKVTPSFTSIDIKVGGKNRNDIKDYIADVFHGALHDQIEYRAVPSDLTRSTPQEKSA